MEHVGGFFLQKTRIFAEMEHRLRNKIFAEMEHRLSNKIIHHFRLLFSRVLPCSSVDIYKVQAFINNHTINIPDNFHSYTYNNAKNKPIHLFDARLSLYRNMLHGKNNCQSN